jgi:hypothetical protein
VDRHVDLTSEERLLELLDEAPLVARLAAVTGRPDLVQLNVLIRGGAEEVGHLPGLRQRESAATRAEPDRHRV